MKITPSVYQNRTKHPWSVRAHTIPYHGLWSTRSINDRLLLEGYQCKRTVSRNNHVKIFDVAVEAIPELLVLPE
jgi:hypothetical protein